MEVCQGVPLWGKCTHLAAQQVKMGLLALYRPVRWDDAFIRLRVGSREPPPITFLNWMPALRRTAEHANNRAEGPFLLCACRPELDVYDRAQVERRK